MPRLTHNEALQQFEAAIADAGGESEHAALLEAVGPAVGEWLPRLVAAGKISRRVVVVEPGNTQVIYKATGA